MIIHHISEDNSVLNNFLAEIRDQSRQKDRMRFRRNIERIGEILGYEMSKSFHFSEESVKTPLGTSKIFLPQDELVICSILRAGIPLHNGLLNYFDKAENSFISAYRKHFSNSAKFEIVVEYLSSPSIENKTLVIADPMLATGRSLVNVYNSLLKMGTPKSIHIVAVIGATPGLEYIASQLPDKVHLWIATIDEKLNENDYIVPGLGDAGDLSFGSKLDLPD